MNGKIIGALRLLLSQEVYFLLTYYQQMFDLFALLWWPVVYVAIIIPGYCVGSAEGTLSLLAICCIQVMVRGWDGR